MPRQSRNSGYDRDFQNRLSREAQYKKERQDWLAQQKAALRGQQGGPNVAYGNTSGSVYGPYNPAPSQDYGNGLMGTPNINPELLQKMKKEMGYPQGQPQTDPYQLPRSGKPQISTQPPMMNPGQPQISLDPRLGHGYTSNYYDRNTNTGYAAGPGVPMGPQPGPRPRPRNGPNTFATDPYQIPMAPGQQQYNGPKIVPMTNTMTPIGPGGPTRQVPGFNPGGQFPYRPQRAAWQPPQSGAWGQ